MFKSRVISSGCAASLMLLGLPAMATVPSEYLRKPADWYNTPEGVAIADNVLTWQTDNGSWPKNTNTAVEQKTEKVRQADGTFDNGATTSELRFLARAIVATESLRFRNAFFKGLDLLFEAQYPTGGWPQKVPPGDNYSRHITFNDSTMVRIMELLREVEQSSDYDFVDEERRIQAGAAFERAVDCVLKCQIHFRGKLTVWCAQHDAIDFQPRPARVYEHVSLSGAESAGLVRLLMRIENPSPTVCLAIESAAEWFESAKLEGIRMEKIGGDRVIVSDANAKPLWARFYEIETNRPIFSGRDGLVKYDLSEIESERRNGYSWYGNWGEDVRTDYNVWKNRWVEEASTR